MDRCHHCGHEAERGELAPAADRTGGTVYICAKCERMIDDVIASVPGDVSIYFHPPDDPTHGE